MDVVKIDGAYVRELTRSSRDEAMNRHMVNLCRELNLATVAEMVETRGRGRRPAAGPRGLRPGLAVRRSGACAAGEYSTAGAGKRQTPRQRRSVGWSTPRSTRLHE
jgi:predicted signal transduction protein with EAL and GGDEF domain